MILCNNGSSYLIFSVDAQSSMIITDTYKVLFGTRLPKILKKLKKSASTYNFKLHCHSNYSFVPQAWKSEFGKRQLLGI